MAEMTRLLRLENLGVNEVSRDFDFGFCGGDKFTGSTPISVVVSDSDREILLSEKEDNIDPLGDSTPSGPGRLTTHCQDPNSWSGKGLSSKVVVPMTILACSALVLPNDGLALGKPSESGQERDIEDKPTSNLSDIFITKSQSIPGTLVVCTQALIPLDDVL